MVLVKNKSQIGHLLMAALMTLVPLLHAPAVDAAGVLANRSVTISDPRVSAITRQDFRFSFPSYQSVGSIKFEYCENSPFVGNPCDMPSGLNVGSANLTGQTGETGFTIMSPTSANRITLTRTAVNTTGVPVTYSFSNIQNPDTVNKTVYVRISTYNSTDATGSTIDEGTVVYSTARNLSVNGYVPPYLTFCVGVTVSIDCSSAAGYQLDFGELVTNTTRTLKSEYSGASNDAAGFSTSLAGVTMTSGNNTIDPLVSPRGSQTGTSQFGLNLRANSSPGIGAEPQGPGSSAPVSQVGTSNQFFFGNQVISTSPVSTDFTKFTVSYIVNVPSTQRPGVYVTTLTYIASAAF